MKTRPKLMPIMKISRLTRIKAYVLALEDIYKPSARKKKKVAGLYSQLDNALWKASVATWVRNFFNIFVYASVITAFSTVVVGADLDFLRHSLNIMSGIIGGTTIALIGAAIANRFINLYFVDLLMTASTISAIYAAPEDTGVDILEVYTEKK